MANIIDLADSDEDTLYRFLDRMTKKVPDRVQSTVLRPQVGARPDTPEFIPYPVNVQELYMMRQYCPVLQTVCVKLRDEIFRKPIFVEKEYASRCPECKINYEDERDECEECGGPTVKPDPKGRRIMEAFLERANDSDQSLTQILKMFEDDTNTTDDGFLIFVKDYVVSSGGKVVGTPTCKEIYRGRPGRIWLVRDRMLRKTGEDARMGRGFFTCVIHREGNLQMKMGNCKVCGKPLVPVTEVALDDDAKPRLGYIDGEVFHDSRYQPSELYGFSNILSLWTLSQTLINMDGQQHRVYKHDRPPKGCITINTDNPTGFYRAAEEEEEKRKENPNYIPKYAFSSKASGQAMSFISFTPTLQDLQNIEQRKEIRERISALFGVSNVMMADTSASGGLNNEGVQIRVTTRAVENAHTQYHQRVFKAIADALGIEGWVYRFPDPIEADKAAIQQRKMSNFNMLMQLRDRGVEPEIEDPEDLSFTFDIKDVEPKEQPSAFGGDPFSRNPFGAGAGGGGGAIHNPEPKLATLVNGNGIEYPIYAYEPSTTAGGAEVISTISPDDGSSISKKKVYVSSPSKAPKGVNVQRGPKGGYYYEGGSGSGGGASTDDDEAPSRRTRPSKESAHRGRSTTTRKPSAMSKRYALESESIEVFTKAVPGTHQTKFLMDENNHPIPHPFDVIDEKNKIAYELKAQVASSKTKTKITKWQQARKEKWAKENGYKAVVVIVELNHVANLYSREGVKPYDRRKKHLWRTVKRRGGK